MPIAPVEDRVGIAEGSLVDPGLGGREGERSLGFALAHLAHRSLLRELLLTPKPGLVDRRNCGSHRDMDLSSFLASARAIAPWFRRFFERGLEGCAVPADLFLAGIRADGMACERVMLHATGGVNTHKGSIFAFGLLCAAAGRLAGQGRALRREPLCAEVAAICAEVVGELRRPGEAGTAGEHLYRRHGLTGARGEAASGFATVRNHALPAFERLRPHGPRMALHAALLELLAFNPDTNVVSRGGLAGLAFLQGEAMRLRRDGGVAAPDYLHRLAALDDGAIRRNLSPGGSADLLAVTWFLAHLPATTPYRVPCH
ncbi:triphosphoribosyl-dephospho-CoA synthase CitG [Azospirillum melinis]|uniref:Probable 2-(5''-triphosphoribosyl)-3'-dephosphocoenzyme-A synthase n=1 Tax=Azospirillum melinis TaxID=328839 RepID=A0ABX2KN14_9PROT|nr:triphosphoribosyl-dephospho-CoA synthase CitG [Azospirillum melinis]MBP2309459.1 triphosphoribosyl-dephospho-CoA synthase [Azospirillum melinis]NUB02669.1 triphosphoribosyl-dephospho-CoA synthase CitG [Azospirillum melinis]